MNVQFHYIINFQTYIQYANKHVVVAKLNKNNKV